MRRLLLLPPVLAALAMLAPALPAVAVADATVVKAQRRLNALRCDAGPADGRVGAHTRTATVRFQSRHRLDQTGNLNSATRRLLHSTRAKRCDFRPVPARSGSGRRIVVSQRQNWVWLVGTGGRVLAEGGIVDNPRVLRKGSWATGSYCGRPARVRLNQSGNVWMDDFVRFAPCGIGFHRIPRSKSTGRQIHADWYLGTNLAGPSHGCVRLSRSLAARLWDFTAGRRTTVRVV
ncbi:MULTISPECIES: L,D-transpeptidase family protein [Nocardioides]|uniref:Peptidoglycan-binding protein n=1 Tax=Nocardioides vastitatis TaxID=2568655 RepID=A0ABW0ZBH3_9ACTN|nr:L,D-transpeptidase family protein [Nocardioides sp.]THJ12577.1 murein L,D-transpeptidase [Nocardioides sp.]